ncbi:MAG: site-specific DNA-methyltransferase [Planctomycetota bacterium]|nr:site-specific DNA-methyltransferase [Planctomycetota bacterium]
MTSVARTSWDAIRSAADVKASGYALFAGDAAERLRDIPSCSVDTCLTSPPYWQARDYQRRGQVGLEAELEEYVGRLLGVFREVKRVLKVEGTAWLNIGDTYLHGVGTVDGKAPARGWKRNKQLCLVPYRVALALQEDGWWLRNVVVWHKPNAMPASVEDRLTNVWEPVFLLTRSERYYFKLDSIRVPHVTDDNVERRRAYNGGSNGKARQNPELRRWLNSPRHRVTIQGLAEVRRRPNAPEATELAGYLRHALDAKRVSLEWVADQLGEPFERVRHYFRTDRIGSRLPPEETWHKLKAILVLDSQYDAAMAVEVGDNVFRNHPMGRNPGDVQSISLSRGSELHFAMMPRKLADWALRATLPEGGTCLDPFMGPGTTGLSTICLGGKFVGIDIRQDYIHAFVRAAREAVPLLA